MAVLKNYSEFISSINWENYKNEDGSYWTISEIISCKLNYLLEDVENLDDEHVDTICILLDVIPLLSDKHIKKLFN